jgi:signal transduction histidine kinase
MSDAAVGAALFGLAATLCLPAVLAMRAHRLSLRLRLLARPLHELRGALAAFELGVTTMERTTETRPELNEWVDAFRVPLERASLGLRDLDACLQGKLPLEAPIVRSHVDLQAVVLQSVRAWSRVASSYQARLRVDWRAGPVRVLGEVARLRQALDNLIANALEHGGGRVLIEGELRGQSVRVKISDGGPGPPRPLSRLADGRRHSKRGHGIAIAYDVIRAHGGRLAAGLGRHGPALVVELPAELAHGAVVRERRRWNARSAAPAGAGSRAPNAA